MMKIIIRTEVGISIFCEFCITRHFARVASEIGFGFEHFPKVL